MLQRGVGNAATMQVLARRSKRTDDVFGDAPDTKDWYRDQRWREYQRKHQPKDDPDAARSGDKFDEPLTEQAIDALIDAGGEKLTAATVHYKLPAFDKIGANETPAERAMMDIRSAASKTREYLEYFNKAVDWVRKTGKSIDLGPAIHNLRGLTGEMSKRLGQVADLVEDVQDATALVRSVAKFANAMDGPLTPENADQWIASAEGLYNGLLPYAEKAKASMLSGAMAGDAAAAEGFLIIGYIAFEVHAGLSLLKAGKGYADKHNAVLKAYLDDPEEAERQRELRAREAELASQDPPAPIMPTGWRSREQEVADVKTAVKAEVRRRWRHQRDLDRRWAIRYFEAELWPKRYGQRRGELAAKLERARRKAVYADYEVEPERNLEWVLGWQEILKTATSRGDEIAKFERLRHGDAKGEKTITLDGREIGACPFYAAMHDEELRRYLVAAKLTWD